MDPAATGIGRFRFALIGRQSWWDDPPPDPKGGPNKVRWPIFAVLFLLPFLIPATRGLVHDTGPLWARVLLGLVLYTYGACYIVFPLVFGRPRQVKLRFGVVMLALGLLCTLVVDTSPYVLLYATACLAFLFPPAWAAMLDLSAFVLVALVLQIDGRLAGSWGDLISVASITLAMFFMANLVRAIRRLEQANREIAALAVANERERVARDLHDLLGHSLTTITVKAGVARRVLESSGDIPRAVQEIREVEGLTRTVLSDVRATVSEYREVSLPAEIAGARAALRAAEIDAELPHAADNVRADLQSTFGYVLREAVTNVLRHSGANRVRVRLGSDWLEVEDDGGAGREALASGVAGRDVRGGVGEAGDRRVAREETQDGVGEQAGEGGVAGREAWERSGRDGGGVGQETQGGVGERSGEGGVAGREARDVVSGLASGRVAGREARDGVRGRAGDGGCAGREEPGGEGGAGREARDEEGRVAGREARDEEGGVAGREAREGVGERVGDGRVTGREDRDGASGPASGRVAGREVRNGVSQQAHNSEAAGQEAPHGTTEDSATTGLGQEVVPGNGLRGLSERLAAVGGTLVIRRRLGGGWVVRAEVPEPGPSGAAESAGGSA